MVVSLGRISSNTSWEAAAAEICRKVITSLLQQVFSWLLPEKRTIKGYVNYLLVSLYVQKIYLRITNIPSQVVDFAPCDVHCHTSCFPAKKKKNQENMLFFRVANGSRVMKGNLHSFKFIAPTRNLSNL